MSDPPIASIREARARLGDVIDLAHREDVPTIITRRSKQVAAVISIDAFRKFEVLEDQADAQLVRERMAHHTGKGASFAEVIAEMLARPE